MEQNFFSSEMINNMVEMINQNESQIQGLLDGIREGQDPELAVISCLVEKYGISEAEATEIVNDITKGMHGFDSQMQTGASSSEQNIHEMLSQLTRDCSEVQTHNCYSNILTALQLLDQDASPEMIESRQNQNLQKTNDQLIAEIEAVWDNSFKFEQFSHSVMDKLDVERLKGVADMVRKSKHEYRLMTAVWLYMAQRDGNVKLSDSKVPVSPVMLGALAAAGVEALIATGDLAENKITLTKWQEVVKVILGVLLFLAMVVMSAMVIGTVGLATIAFVLSIFDFGLFGIILSSIAAILIVYILGGKTIDWCMSLFEWFDDFYDHSIVRITDKIKSVVAKIRKWLSSHKRNKNPNDNPSNEASGGCESENENTSSKEENEEEHTQDDHNEEENPA